MVNPSLTQETYQDEKENRAMKAAHGLKKQQPLGCRITWRTASFRVGFSADAAGRRSGNM